MRRNAPESILRRHFAVVIGNGLGVFERAGEAMENAAEAGGLPVLLDLREAIVPGVAAMDDDGELGFARLA